MAAVPVTELSQEQKEELLCVYSALILHDDEAEVSAANMSKLIEASGGSVEPYWPSLFARLLSGKDIGEMLMSTGGGSGPAAGDAGPAAAGGDAPAAAMVEEKVEEEEEEDVDFDLFG